MDELVLRSRRVLVPEGSRPLTVVVRDGRIAALQAYDAVPVADVELGDVALLPGLVDTHVHVNEPGRTEWEGFATATRAAAAGGVTTIVDMPLNSIPPTIGTGELAAKQRAARGRVFTDVGFWAGAVPGNVPALRPLQEAGVFGFKCFTSPSGVAEFPALPWDEVRAAMAEIASFGGLLIAHAEDPEALADPAGGAFADFLASRPPHAETGAISRLIDTAAGTGCRLHIVHLSAAEALPLVAEARRAGVAVTAETCPHYLTLSAEEVPEGATQFKCCPPIRSQANRELLWEGLAEGVLSLVVSDHSPCVPELKRGDFATAWGGISSVQVGLPAVWTQARSRGHSLEDVVRWMAAGPADLVGLRGKGRIAVGNDADLVAFDPDETSVVDPGALHHRHRLTPYAGRSLTGVVRSTWLRGVPAGDAPRGRLLTRL